MVSEALLLSFKATKLSCTSPLPWISVIEALESFNGIDTSLLIDLVKRTPEMSDDMGRIAKEMVSLRVLESLFFRKIPSGNYVPGAKFELDPSKCCEDVLHHVLFKVSASDLNTATPEMLKWDFRPFIMKKRSRLPKCLLQQLKDAIIDSTNPFSESLRERSGFEFWNHSRDSVPLDSDGFTQGHVLGGVNTQHVAPTGYLDTFIQGNTNGLQENKSGSTLVPAKRSCDASAAYEIEVNETEAITESNSDPCGKVAKKFKQYVVSPIQNTVPDLMLSQKDGFPAESCGGSQPVQKGNLEDDARIGAFEAIGFLKDGGAECGASRSVLCGRDSEHNVLLPKRMSAHKKFQNIGSSSNGNAELGTSSGSSQLVTQQDSHTHGSEYDLGCNLPQDLQKICKENIACSDEFEFSSDTDEYHDESTGLSAQKINFLNSQCAQSEDSFANADCNELNLCVKCNEGGKLLVCSSDTCPLTVHESCLGSIPNFDHKGNFYCPFCAYSRAICEYQEGKKMVSLARTDFAAFIDFGAGQQSKKSLPRSQGTKKNQSQQDKNEELSHNENGKKLNTVSAEA